MYPVTNFFSSFITASETIGIKTTLKVNKIKELVNVKSLPCFTLSPVLISRIDVSNIIKPKANAKLQYTSQKGMISMLNPHIFGPLWMFYPLLFK